MKRIILTAILLLASLQYAAAQLNTTPHDTPITPSSQNTTPHIA